MLRRRYAAVDSLPRYAHARRLRQRHADISMILSRLYMMLFDTT